ncbi:hypothetical protein [Desulfovibrio desulfuricans]|uniref:hypothetical protein n=1 Tax=Desulfovibrio desulfuricans TaxID=876 RepID=UPI001C015902|nr:hypothetical protein [Desulfovibrio desulfuricans]MBT9748626.1 hypothetical protein [Desulfovibrio desulfuricans]
MRFVGTIVDETGKEIDVDVPAHDESPDFVVISTEDGGKMVGADSPIAEDGTASEFWVGTVETDDGQEIEITSNDLGDSLELVDDSNDNNESDDDF